MKTISKLLLLLFLFITINSYSQDTIKSISGNNIVSRVLEVNDTEIKYKTFDNLEGPLYVIKKKNVESITYTNGVKEFYKNTEKEKSELDASFYEKTSRGKKVFIDAVDGNGIIHATRNLRRWNYWVITEDKSEADFILDFIYRFGGLGDAFGYAQFIDVKSGMVIKTTEDVNTVLSMDWNPKRAVIDKIIKKEIRRIFEN